MINLLTKPSFTMIDWSFGVAIGALLASEQPWWGVLSLLMIWLAVAVIAQELGSDA